jgi:hypothetical protein
MKPIRREVVDPMVYRYFERVSVDVDATRGVRCICEPREESVRQIGEFPKRYAHRVQMLGELPENLEGDVLRRLRGALKSREGWEAARPDHLPPVNDDQVMLQNLASMIDRQGVILADLAVLPPTKAALKTTMPEMVNRAPAWLEAHLHGVQEMTLELFLRGIAQTQTEQREAFERVVAEQVSDPEPIEETLAQAPVPPGSEEESRSEIMSGVFQAMAAHTKALADIAHDLELQFARHINPTEED